jgi:hypothetical protein
MSEIDREQIMVELKVNGEVNKSSKQSKDWESQIGKSKEDKNRIDLEDVMASHKILSEATQKAIRIMKERCVQGEQLLKLAEDENIKGNEEMKSGSVYVYI